MLDCRAWTIKTRYIITKNKIGFNYITTKSLKKKQKWNEVYTSAGIRMCERMIIRSVERQQVC